MLCPRCNQANPDDARFCNACGVPLDQGTPPADESLHLDLLHRYISKPLADRMRAMGGRIEGERRHVTVMFADISGFTAMSEKLDPEDVTTVMNACFKELVEVVFKYEGTIDKFIGDEIMALFGVPIAHENDPERAVRAALEMQERLRVFNETLKVSLPKPLTMHVGINSGEVIAGNVGSDLRMDYSVLGDTVNLAARLEAASQSGQIFVSDRTYALTRHVFDFRRLKPFKVQGKQRKVQVYEVQGVKKVLESGRGVQAGYGPLINREGEAAILRETVEAVRQGQGRVMGVVGEAGIGKSRLVYELRGMVEGFTVASGACTSYEAPPAYQVFTEVMRGLLRIEADDPEGVVRQRVEAWVAANDLDAETIPYLGSLFALRDERLLYLQDEARYERVREAVLSVLRAVTANGPLLIVLEDLHWIDPASRRLLNDLAGQASSLSLLLCCVYRPEFQHEWEGIPGYRTLAVEPLSREHTVALSESIVKLDLPPELEQAILSRAEGNPFFVEEMLKALMDEGVIAKTRTGYELRRDVSQVNLPATMQGVIMARIDRLEAQARETLQVASVIGRRFSEALLKAVSPRSQRVERDLEQLQGLDLVYQQGLLPDLEYIFKHFVTREVAYNSILVKRRKAIHLETARAMERIYRERLEEYYEALAHHFEAGEEWQKAADYFGKAGTKARELHSDAGATAFMERREQAVQKVFEQKEKGTKSRRFSIGYWIFFAAFLAAGPLILIVSKFRIVWTMIGLMYTGGFIIAIYFLIISVKTRAADSVTIYADRLLIRGRKEFISIPFQDITSAKWVRSYRGFFKESWKYWKTKVRVFIGTVSIRKYSKDAFYFGIANAFQITCQGDRSFALISQNSGDLYRELKFSMTKWAVAQKVDIKEVFEGSPSRFEEQFHLPLRQSDSTPLSLTTYDQLIEKIERGEVSGHNEIALRNEQSERETYINIETAGQEDRRLWAALHPLRYSVKACYLTPMGLVMGAILFITSSFTIFFFGLENLKVFHWSFLVEFLICGILWQPLVLGIYLRVGILEWAKRHVVSIWSRMGLKVIAGVLVLAFMVASFILAGLGIFFTSTEYRGRSYLKQGKYQETVKMLGPLVYLYIQPRQKMISGENYKAAIEVLGRLYQERPRWLMVGLGPNIFTQANLAVALAKNGDPAGARAVMNVLIEAGERLYPSDYKEGRLTGYEGMPVYKAFAEIYLIDHHTISPDGAGLDEFEKGVPEKDHGKALRYLGHVLRDQGKKEAALSALRRALKLLEPGSQGWQRVQEEVRELQAAGGEDAGRR